jgi:hypothetical protein
MLPELDATMMSTPVHLRESNPGLLSRIAPSSGLCLQYSDGPPVVDRVHLRSAGRCRLPLTMAALLSETSVVIRCGAHRFYRGKVERLA